MNDKTNLPAPLTAPRAAKSSVLGLSVLAAFGMTNALAFELGHSRVTSSPGQALVVQVPITAMSPQEAESLSVSIAPAAAWQSTGLTPPVPLDSLSLSVVAGRNAGSRLVELRSTQAAQSSVIDVLLAVTTSSSSRTVQASIIVPPAPNVRLAGDQVTVQRGDTLIGIAEQFPVSGANLYQQLWALYSSNPDAFLRQNMNLLKAGAALRIPDADAVRAVDPAFAKAQYLEHVRAFRQSRGGGQGNQGIAAQASAQTLQSPPEQKQGDVEQARTEPPPPANDQVRLTAAQQDTQAAQADAQAAQAKALAEELERKRALEQNIAALQGAIASSAQGDQGGAVTQSQAETSSGSQAGGQSTTQTDNQPAGSASDQSSTDRSQNGTGTAESPNLNTAGEQSGQSANAGGSAPDVDSSANLFTRVGQWVTDNTTAAIALLLALIALILAWALRATKTKPSEAQEAEKRVDHAAADFEQKLKNIDLSLDQKPEPTFSKPDNKA
ncbi:MAG: hypothetical protein LRY49_09045 [Burkholderiaceae bacterium]|nr:hypothetical protein [Burkholderiaceae bacterium]